MNMKIEASHQRQIEWWSILNARRIPKDMPEDFAVDELFDRLSRVLPKRQRLDFWSGEFGCGLNVHKFIDPARGLRPIKPVDK